MAYLAGNPLHGYKTGCPQRRRLECVSVSGVPLSMCVILPFPETETAGSEDALLK